MFARKNGVGIMLMLGLVFSAIRTVLLSLNIEVSRVYEDQFYYLPDSFAFKAFAVATILAVVIALYLAIVGGRKRKIEFDRKNFVVSAASCMLAFVMMGEAVMFFSSEHSSEYSESVDAVAAKFLTNKLEFLMIMLAVVCGVVFLVNGVRINSTCTLSLFTLAPLVFSAVRIIEEFLRAGSSPRASSGSYHILGLVAVLLYFLCEGKAFSGIGSAAFYYFYGYCSILLLLIYSVPNIILPCFGPFEFDYHTFLSVVDLVLAVYIASRMASVKENYSEIEESNISI